MNCLAAALEYARRGFRVFPLHAVREGVCTCQEWRDANDKGPCPTPGKHPQFRNWQERATCDSDTTEEFWWNHKGSNIGVATGATSGVFVLDVDPKNSGQESIDALVMKHGRIDTLQAITGSRGKHYYFEHPGKPVKNGVALLPGPDIRGDGGLVVAPPSIHVSGSKSSRTCPFSRHRAGCWNWCTASEQMGTRPVLNCRRRSRRANATRPSTGMPAHCAAPAAGSSSPRSSMPSWP